MTGPARSPWSMVRRREAIDVTPGGLLPGTRPPDPWPTYAAGPVSCTLTYDDGQEKRVYVVSRDDVDVLRSRWEQDRDAVAAEVAERSVLLSAEAVYPG